MFCSKTRYNYGQKESLRLFCGVIIWYDFLLSETQQFHSYFLKVLVEL